MPSSKAPSSSAGATATDLRKPEHVGEPQPHEPDVTLLERAQHEVFLLAHGRQCVAGVLRRCCGVRRSPGAGRVRSTGPCDRRRHTTPSASAGRRRGAVEGVLVADRALERLHHRLPARQGVRRVGERDVSRLAAHGLRRDPRDVEVEADAVGRRTGPAALAPVRRDEPRARLTNDADRGARRSGSRRWGPHPMSPSHGARSTKDSPCVRRGPHPEDGAMVAADALRTTSSRRAAAR